MLVFGGVHLNLGYFWSIPESRSKTWFSTLHGIWEDDKPEERNESSNIQNIIIIILHLPMGFSVFLGGSFIFQQTALLHTLPGTITAKAPGKMVLGFGDAFLSGFRLQTCAFTPVSRETHRCDRKKNIGFNQFFDKKCTDLFSETFFFHTYDVYCLKILLHWKGLAAWSTLKKTSWNFDIALVSGFPPPTWWCPSLELCGFWQGLVSFCWKSFAHHQ